MKTTTSTISNPINDSLLPCALILIAFVLMCVALLPRVQAVSPPPDGGYPNGNTAEGQNALQSNTTGGFNAAVGWFSLFANTTGSNNTAVGAGALDLNRADSNTATGAAALLFNTTGAQNTANGTAALEFNDTGTNNTAVGSMTLLSNTTGNLNTASGVEALEHNTIGTDNTANGVDALFNNTTGSGNTALGVSAGFNQTIGDDNIYIGSSGVGGVAGESNSCYIGSIVNQPSPNGIQVFINSNNKLGTSVSSARFKENIKPMDKSSEALFALNPVAFRYKKEFDPTGTSQFGLVAEDVEKVSSDLIVRDKEGKPYSVRYDQVNAMLLNEFLKEHKAFVQEQRKVQELEKQIEKLAVGLHKVSAQFEASKPAPQVVNNP